MLFKFIIKDILKPLRLCFGLFQFVFVVFDIKKGCGMPQPYLI